MPTEDTKGCRLAFTLKYIYAYSHPHIHTQRKKNREILKKWEETMTRNGEVLELAPVTLMCLSLKYSSFFIIIWG